MSTIKINPNRTSQELLVEARRHLAEGDLLQASEKGWGAAAQMVKSVAESRGWPHNDHHHLWQAISRLVEETGDKDISMGFAAAETLYTNFYENWQPAGNVASYLNLVEDLLLKLEALNRAG